MNLAGAGDVDCPTGGCLLVEYWDADGARVNKLAPLDRLGMPSIICEAEQQRFRITHDTQTSLDDCRI